MDRSEVLVRDHLVSRGFSNPVYEPDGKVPPDFLVDGRIAIEVRRLNENERDSPSPRGLEETEIPLLMGMQNLTKSFGPATDTAWWLALRYRRPFPEWGILAPATRAFLEAVRDGSPHARVARHIHENVHLEAIPRRGTGGDMFHVAIMSDEDSGGWVFEELERNLRLCVAEKAEKIRDFQDRYPEWWLVLVDHVAYGLSEYDRAEFKANVHIDHSWDKIILVNPLDHTHYFEL